MKCGLEEEGGEWWWFMWPWQGEPVVDWPGTAESGRSSIFFCRGDDLWRAAKRVVKGGICIHMTINDIDIDSDTRFVGLRCSFVSQSVLHF